MTQAFQIRAVQLDLARQMESVAFVRKFIDIVSAYGFNTLFLYLEWRIRTRSVDLGPDQGYSPEELRAIMEHAASRGMQVIPGLATLGHAELLLRQDAFASYAEVREGIRGRFGGDARHVFCPSLPETRKFLQGYLGEVADIFAESPYLHVGGDEAWDMACCPKCRQKAPDFQGEQELYRDHFLFIHQVVRGLGKRMMMWDDMFELYPDVLADMPRDVVMVHWQYGDNVCGSLGHFNNQNFQEPFTEYDALGFEYLFASADYTWSNNVTSTAHARNFKPLGGLMTSWEKQETLLFKYLPVMAATGLMWKNPEIAPDAAMENAVRSLFGIQEDCFIRGMAEYAQRVRGLSRISEAHLSQFDFHGPDNDSLAALETLLAVLRDALPRLQKELAKTVLQDVIADCRLKVLALRSQRAAWNRWHGQEGEWLESLIAPVEEVARDYCAMIADWRRPQDVQPFAQLAKTWTESLQTMEEKLNHQGRLRLVVGLPDTYSAQRLKVMVNGKTVAEGCFKVGNRTLFELFFALPSDTEVKTVRLESHGFGGLGIAYVSAESAERLFIPQGITAAEGVIEHPECILKPTVTYAFLGTRDTEECFWDRRRAETVHAVTIAMKDSML